MKSGVYGHVDMDASVLDYFGFTPPKDVSGRSLFREYSNGREMVSFTNGMLRFHDGKQTFTECDFQQVCRRYKSDGFIADSAQFVGRFSGRDARLVAARAGLLDHSVTGSGPGGEYQFATQEKIRIKPQVTNEYTDNLIGAQYLEFPADSHTTVNLKIRALQMDKAGAKVQLKTREFERPVDLAIPEFPLLTRDKPLQVTFGFDNERARKAFSFHLLAEGKGIIEITDFHVQTQPRKSAIDASEHPTRVAGGSVLPGPRIGGRPALMAGQLDQLDEESRDDSGGEQQITQ